MILSFEGGSSRSHYVEESFWRRLWTCRQTEYWMNGWMNIGRPLCGSGVAVVTNLLCLLAALRKQVCLLSDVPTIKYFLDFIFPPRCNWGLRSSVMLGSYVGSSLPTFLCIPQVHSSSVKYWKDSAESQNTTKSGLRGTTSLGLFSHSCLWPHRWAQ